MTLSGLEFSFASPVPETLRQSSNDEISTSMILTDLEEQKEQNEQETQTDKKVEEQRSNDEDRECANEESDRMCEHFYQLCKGDPRLGGMTIVNDENWRIHFEHWSNMALGKIKIGCRPTCALSKEGEVLKQRWELFYEKIYETLDHFITPPPPRL